MKEEIEKTSKESRKLRFYKIWILTNIGVSFITLGFKMTVLLVVLFFVTWLIAQIISHSFSIYEVKKEIKKIKESRGIKLMKKDIKEDYKTVSEEIKKLKNIVFKDVDDTTFIDHVNKNGKKWEGHKAEKEINY
jgi:uncharacterized membrane protein YciS (DUF1049 family)